MIRKTNVARLRAARAFPSLLAEYAAECALEGLPPPSVRWDTYADLETAGLLHVLGAYDDDGELIGFLSLVVPVLPHYGVGVAVSESFFVTASRRSCLAGLRLLSSGEALAIELGSPALLVSAPSKGNLCELLPKCAYRETNRVFIKQLTHG